MKGLTIMQVSANILKHKRFDDHEIFTEKNGNFMLCVKCERTSDQRKVKVTVEKEKAFICTDCDKKPANELKIASLNIRGNLYSNDKELLLKN